MNRIIAVALLVIVAHAAWSKEAAPAAADPALEERTMALAGVLRCMVCQNQTLADSNASLAVDLRNQIREQMRQGASEKQIIDFMVARYGDFVLYRPRFQATTVLLWVGPLVFILGGVAGLYVLLRRRRNAPDATVSETERERARALLDSGAEQP